MRIAPHSKLLMIGDSITDANRARPVAEANGDALGRGYVALVNALIQLRYPGHAVRVVNMGLNGNTVRDLKARWKADVFGQQPDWVSVMIGINDVWRQFDTPLLAETHVGLAEYRRELEALVTSTLPRVQGMVLMTPYFLEPDRHEPMRAMMDRYGEVVKAVAAEHGAVLVDTQAAMDVLLQHQHPMSLCWDRVHPNLTGHLALAEAFMAALASESR